MAASAACISDMLASFQVYDYGSDVGMEKRNNSTNKVNWSDVWMERALSFLFVLGSGEG